MFSQSSCSCMHYHQCGPMFTSIQNRILNTISLWKLRLYSCRSTSRNWPDASSRPSLWTAKDVTGWYKLPCMCITSCGAVLLWCSSICASGNVHTLILPCTVPTHSRRGVRPLPSMRQEPTSITYWYFMAQKPALSPELYYKMRVSVTLSIPSFNHWQL